MNEKERICMDEKGRNVLITFHVSIIRVMTVSDFTFSLVHIAIRHPLDFNLVASLAVALFMLVLCSSPVAYCVFWLGGASVFNTVLFYFGLSHLKSFQRKKYSEVGYHSLLCNTNKS